jgi:hypothetical protein
VSDAKVQGPPFESMHWAKRGRVGVLVLRQRSFRFISSTTGAATFVFVKPICLTTSNTTDVEAPTADRLAPIRNPIATSTMTAISLRQSEPLEGYPVV